VPDGHCLENRSAAPATYLAVGDRTVPEYVEYSEHDLVLEAGPQIPKSVLFRRRDGTPY
jgi:uncharacterized cupin superfamily protein